MRTKALMAIRESNGLTVNVSDEEILEAQKLLGRTCGVFGEPAGVTGTARGEEAQPSRASWERRTPWCPW